MDYIQTLSYTILINLDIIPQSQSAKFPPIDMIKNAMVSIQEIFTLPQTSRIAQGMTLFVSVQSMQPAFETILRDVRNS